MTNRQKRLVENYIRKIVISEISKNKKNRLTESTDKFKFFRINGVSERFKKICADVNKMGAFDCIYDHGQIIIVLDKPNKKIQQYLGSSFENIEELSYEQAVDDGIIDPDDWL